MDILKIKNEDGSWSSIPAIIGPKGEKGDPGEVGLKGEPGTNGKDATLNGKNALTLIQGENISLNQEGDNLTISATGGSKKYARFVIGCSSGGWAPEDVDYFCDGINDEVEINQAIQAISADQGGEIILLDGIYEVAGEIIIDKEYIILRGVGNNTVINRTVSSPDERGISILKNYVTVSNLQIINTSATPQEFKAIYAGSIYHFNIKNNIFKNCDYGIFAKSSMSDGSIINNSFIGGEINGAIGISITKGGSNSIIANNYCSKMKQGFSLYISESQIVDNNIENFSEHEGINFLSGSNNLISGNKCISTAGTWGLSITSTRNIIINNYFSGKLGGINANNLDESVINDNFCSVPNGISINVTGGSSNNIITNNICIGGAPTIEGSGNIVDNNKIQEEPVV